MGGKATKEQRDRWKRNNPDKLREGRKRYKSRPEVKERSRLAQQRRRARIGHKVLVEAARHRATKRGLEFSLPDDWKADVTHCEWCGIPFERRNRMYAASIDRVDDGKGYTEDNCRLILNGLNVFKNKFSDEDVIRIARALLDQVGG